MLAEHHQIGTVAENRRLVPAHDPLLRRNRTGDPVRSHRGGFRLYTESDIDRLRLVKALKPVGMSLETLNEILGAADALAAANRSGTGVEHAAREFQEVLETPRRRCDELEGRLEQAHTALAWLDGHSTADIPADPDRVRIAASNRPSGTGRE